MVSAVVFIFWPEEIELIETCLKTLNWVDEIVVIDNGAPKGVVEIAKRYTNKIFFCESKNFAQRHNFAKEKCSGDWVLFIDSDERISIALAKRIKEKLLNPDASAYQLNRINYFLGKRVRYGERCPDYVTRLFKKELLKPWTGEIHESSHVDGAVVKLEEPFFHLTHRDLYSMVEKTINFAENEAKLRIKVNHPPIVWWRLVRVFVTELFHRIIIHQGWRQGTEGWIDGIFQAFSIFVVYARVWELQKGKTMVQIHQDIDKNILEGSL